MKDLLCVGSRVRLRQSMLPGLPELHDEGVVKRIDARGVLVRMDSGAEVLCEAGALMILAPDVSP
jgi:hypothetical protein